MEQSNWGNNRLQYPKFEEKLNSDWCVTGVLYRHTTRSILTIFLKSLTPDSIWYSLNHEGYFKMVNNKIFIIFLCQQEYSEKPCSFWSRGLVCSRVFHHRTHCSGGSSKLRQLAVTQGEINR